MRRWPAMLVTLALAVPNFAQTPAVLPRPVQSDTQRLADLMAIIEGQNTLQARRTAARELLRQAWPDTPVRLASILAGSNRPARIAVSQALADSREHLDDRYIEPLIGMLADSEPEARQVAGVALATYGSPAVVQRLERLLSEAETAQLCKLAAIDALGNMTQPAALGVLLSLTADPASPLCRPALAALERATAQDFSNDPQRALDWWRDAQGKDATVWQQLQIERLVRQSNGLAQRTRELESRLVAALRDGYLRLPEADRATQLTALLADPIDAVRVLGLEIVQGQLTEGKTPPAELVNRCRSLISAPEPRVRAAAIRTVSALRDKGDAENFRKLLADETASEVRLALVGGLGYSGGAETIQTLIPLITGEDPALAEEAIASIGRLAERGELDGPSRDATVKAVLSRSSAILPRSPTSRERELRSLAKLGDSRVATILFAALEPKEPSPIRVAAIRGLAAIAMSANGAVSESPNATAPSTNGANATSGPVPLKRIVAEAFLPLLADGDTQVRRAALEGLSAVADTETHLQAFWQRLNPASEPDETLRGQAWKAILAYLAGRPVREIQTVSERIADAEPVRSQRRLDLEQLIEKALVGDPQQRAELGLVRARIAVLRADLNQVPEAQAAYLAALESLSAAASPELPRVANEFLHFSLLNDRYDAQVATELNPERVGLDIAAMWKTVCEVADLRMKRDGPAHSTAVLTAFQSNPPAALPEAIQQELAARLHDAKSRQADESREKVRRALGDLRADPASVAAKQALVTFGSKALPELRRELVAEINSPTRNPQLETALCELAKTLQPAWPGIPANASIADKLKAVESLEG